MSPAQRVLVIDRDARRLRSLPRLLKRAGSAVIAEMSSSIKDALERVRAGGYDAIVCRVDGPDEVSLLIRIKHAAPDLQLVAVTPDEDEALGDLARESGADSVESYQDRMVARSRVESLQTLLTSVRDRLDRSKQLQRENKELVARARRMFARTRILAGKHVVDVEEIFAGFSPLLVEDDPDQIMLTTQAFQRAGFKFFLPPLRDGQEAIQYLSGKGGYEDRRRHPLPSLVLLDINLPRKTGLDVLEWIRSRGEFAHLPVFMLTSTAQHFDRAMSLGATDFYLKPLQFRSLVDIVREIAVRWWFLKQAFGKSGCP